MRILGIDPGKTTGLVIIEIEGTSWRLIERLDVPPYGEDNQWLLDLYTVLYPRLESVDVAVMEQMLSYRNATADEKMEAQGVIKFACAQVGCPLITYAPVTVRSTICCDGHADERSIRRTLRFLLNLPERTKPGEGWSAHQYDALAVALCHLVRTGVPLGCCEKGEANEEDSTNGGEE